MCDTKTFMINKIKINHIFIRNVYIPNQLLYRTTEFASHVLIIVIPNQQGIKNLNHFSLYFKIPLKICQL